MNNFDDQGLVLRMAPNCMTSFFLSQALSYFAAGKLAGGGMKMLFAILFAAVLMPGAPALASSLNASPLIGSWAVDVSHLPIPPQERPKSVTITFIDAGDGGWTTQVDFIDAAGAENHSVGTAALNGKPIPVTSSNEADIAATEMPTPSVLVLSLGKDGSPASTRIYAVAANGKTMTETVVYFWNKGEPIPSMRTNHFTRIR
ncbi:MAG: hypothetical protein ABI379_00730 [Rhodanobacter sp.]